MTLRILGEADTDLILALKVEERYAANLEGQESEESEGGELPKVSITEALKHLEGVRLWQLQQEDTVNQDLQATDCIKRGIRLKKANSMVQPSITSFFHYRD